MAPRFAPALNKAVHKILDVMRTVLARTAGTSFTLQIRMRRTYTIKITAIWNNESV